MFFLCCTTPAEKPAPGTKSTGRTMVTWMLVFFWAMLIAFGGISIVNPDWLRELSQAGRKVEAKSYKDHGDNFLRQRQLGLAVAQYREALKIRPEYTGALVNLAVTYIQAGHSQKAIELLKNSLKMDNIRPGIIYYNLADIYDRQGETDQALAFYRQALDYDIERSLVYRRLGAIYMAREDYPQALEAFTGTLAAQKDIMAPFRRMLRRSQEALVGDTANLAAIEELLHRDLTEDEMERYDFDIIVRLQARDPEIAKTHNHLGFIHAQRGDFTAAIEQFEISNRLWPGNIDAVKNLPVLKQKLADTVSPDSAD